MTQHPAAPQITSTEFHGRSGRAPLSTADFGVLKLWEALTRRWLVVSLGVILGWALAITYFVVWPKTYESSAKVLVMRKDPTVAAAGVTRGTEVEGPEVTSELLATHMVLLKSRKIVSEALARDGLDQLPSIVTRINAAQGQTPADYVIENLVVTGGGEGPAQDAHVLNVAFRHASPADAQRVVESVVQRYHDFLNEKFIDLNSEAAQLIVQARLDLEEELRRIEEEYHQFRQEAPLLWESQQGTMNAHRIQYEELQRQLAAIEVETNQARARLELAEKAVAEMKERGAPSLELLAIIDAENTERVNLLASVQQGEARSAQFQSLQPERTAAAQTQYASLPDLMARERTLLQDFGPFHPEVVETRNNIAAISEFMNNRSASLEVGEQEQLDAEQLVSAYLSLLRNDKASLERRQADLQAAAEREEKAAKAIVTFELQQEELRSRLERTQELYTVVIDRLRDINLAKDYGGFIHEVIAAPKVGQPIWPQLLLCLVLGTFGGFVFGGTGALALELRDTSFHTPDEIEQTLDLPLLTHVPSLTPSRQQQASAASGGVDPRIAVFHRPRSSEAEVFRGLRTSLFYREQHQSLKVIAITGPVHAAGTSLVAANLAVSLAQSGRRVLLVDCNLRAPSVHRLFAATGEHGLADVVSGKIDPPDAVQPTAVHHLSVVTAGTFAVNPSELLASVAFRQWLDLIREHYDQVLLDCPPVLAVSDSSIVAPLADAVVLVMRIGKQARSRLLLARNMLSDVGAPLVGTVVNAWNLPRRGYGVRSRYKYRTEYQDADEIETPDLARTSGTTN